MGGHGIETGRAPPRRWGRPQDPDSECDHVIAPAQETDRLVTKIGCHDERSSLQHRSDRAFQLGQRLLPLAWCRSVEILRDDRSQPLPGIFEEEPSRCGPGSSGFLECEAQGWQ
jgi:hypothetical protein